MPLISLARFSAFATTAFLLFLPLEVRAEDKILFIGNSFTYGDSGTASVPTIFDRLAVAGGHADPTVVMRAVGGQDFQFHENDATTRGTITSNQWTYVVLQNYSTEPTHIDSVADHMIYGTALYNRVMTNNPATRVILYETWARSAKNALITGVSSPTTFSSTEEMQAELRTNYADLRNALNSGHPSAPSVTIAPVGDSWENAGGLLPASHPDFRGLHAADDYHGNDNGYFLSASVFYSLIYGSSPVGLHTHSAVSSLNLKLTVDPVYLEQIAWGTVTGTLGIQYTAQPASLAVTENQPATFTAKVRGSLPYTVQWFRNASPVPGADQLTLTIPNAGTALHGSVFTAKVTNAVSSTTSSPVTLSVMADGTPPAAGIPSLQDPLHISLPFNEVLAAGPASIPGNFTVIYQGRRVPVLSSSVSGNGSCITLTLASPIGSGFVVGLSTSLTDIAGNPIVAGSVVVSPAPTVSGTSYHIDFGANENTTGPANDTLNAWNNVNVSIGTSNTGTINPLVGVNGSTGTARLEMVRRFNTANGNGTTATSAYPVTATQDSLYGNTESFNGLSNIFPAFRLAGLDPLSGYSLTFYASRTGVTDIRETLYTVTGKSVNTAVLNVANNITNTVTLAGLSPAIDGTLLIELSPSSRNNNANHFTYLGVLVISASSTMVPEFHPPALAEGRIVLDWKGTGTLQYNDGLSSPWTSVTPVPSPPYTELLSGPKRFFRLSYPKP